MTVLVFWLVVLGGPVACALAGAGVEYVFMSRRCQRQADAAYAEGWDDSDARVRAYYGSIAWHAEQALSSPAIAALSGAVAAAPTLPVLPAVHHEGPRHARPQQPAQGDDPDIMILGVRASFDAIRYRFGLPCPADPQPDINLSATVLAPGEVTEVIP